MRSPALRSPGFCESPPVSGHRRAQPAEIAEFRPLGTRGSDGKIGVFGGLVGNYPLPGSRSSK